MGIFAINPKRLFSSRSRKKSRSVSRSDQASFSSSSSTGEGGSATPTSVLPQRDEISEVLQHLRKEGLGEEELESVLRVKDGAGQLVPGIGPVSVPDLRETFDYFDSDGDGRVTAEDLMAVFHTIGNSYSLDECRSMVATVARMGCDFVGFDDFLLMMGLTS